MFDIGMSELLVVGVVALIVVGPKDLPGMFRTLGRFTARAKSMAREFSRAMESAADEAGMKDAADALKGAANPKKFGLDKLNEAADSFEKWDPMKGAEKDTKTPVETGGPFPNKTSELSPERAEMAKKISDAAAKKATERKAAEAAAAKAEVAESTVDSAAAMEPAKKASAPKAKKAPAKKAAAKPAKTRATTTAKTTAKTPAAKTARASAKKTEGDA